jgi:polycomb protein EED
MVHMDVFELDRHLSQEGTRAIYSASFNWIHTERQDLLAVTSGDALRVYDLSYPHAQALRACWRDENEQEDFYALDWALGLQNQVCLVAGGVLGAVKVLDCHSGTCRGLLRGHGAAINEIKTNPNELSIVLSCSKDKSIRVWNVKSMTCLAILAGDEGHQEEVLSIVISIHSNN